MKKKLDPRLMITLSMVVFGTIALFVKNISVSSAELALYRAVLASALIGVYLLITGNKIEFSKIKRSLILLLFSGAAMGMNWILLFEAYRYTTVSAATLSYYFAPVIVTVVCPIIFHEKLTKKQVLCFVMSTVGLILITGTGGSGSGTDHIGILLGLGAAVLYATVVTVNKFIKDVDGIQRTFLQFTAAMITLAPYVAFTSGFSLSGLDGKGWLLLLTVGVFHTGITYCMYFTALRDVPGQKAAILSYIDPLVAVIISVTLLEETMTWEQVIGGLLILGFTLWNEIGPIKRKK